jgi:hypothetical protein
VQPAGSSSFAPHHSVRVAKLGTNQASPAEFNIGDNVRARVRYYNLYGQAEWSPFSNTVSFGITPPPAKDKGKVLGKRQPVCILRESC